MKQKTLKLSELKVSSFPTLQSDRLKGGTGPIEPPIIVYPQTYYGNTCVAPC